MSSHRRHRKHVNDSYENNNQNNNETTNEPSNETNNETSNGKNTFDINNIAELINSIKPEDLSALIATFNVQVRKLLNK